MNTYIFVGLSAFAAGVVTGVLLLILVLKSGDGIFSRRNRQNAASLNRFNFDKQKSYEKEGRKFPFSY